MNFSELFHKFVFRPQITLHSGRLSSLYILRAGIKIRVLCTIDADPLFDREIVTLLRIAKNPEEYPKIFSQLAESLYQRDLALAESGDLENGYN